MDETEIDGLLDEVTLVEGVSEADCVCEIVGVVDLLLVAEDELDSEMEGLDVTLCVRENDGVVLILDVLEKEGELDGTGVFVFEAEGLEVIEMEGDFVIELVGVNEGLTD